MNHKTVTFAFVAFGSNQPAVQAGPADIVRHALQSLENLSTHAGFCASRLFRSAAWPPGSGPDFVNGVARLETTLPPTELLAELHRIEDQFGRVRDRRWGPRSLDLDLLAHGGAVLPDADTVRAWMALPADRQVVQSPDRLILPHPRLHDRGFVLVPWAELAPRWCHPITGHSVTRMLSALPADSRVGVTPLPA